MVMWFEVLFVLEPLIFTGRVGLGFARVCVYSEIS